MKHFLATAIEASEVAQDIILKNYSKQSFSVAIKEDLTPVTEVDVAVEQAIKEIILSKFPEHGFYGEEEGQQNIDAEYVWLIDPIDGTKAFVRGRPFFSTQIALFHQSEFILGLSRAPAFNGGEFAYALKGEGAFLNQKSINVSDVSSLDQAVFSSGNIKTLTKDAALWKKYAALIQAVNTTRGFGDFLHYHFLAAGKVDLILESELSILDIAALSVIVKEAGGIMTDLYGAPLTLKTTSILAGNPKLHADALKILHG